MTLRSFPHNFLDGTICCLSQPAIVNIVYFVAMDGFLVSWYKMLGSIGCFTVPFSNLSQYRTANTVILIWIGYLPKGVYPQTYDGF